MHTSGHTEWCSSDHLWHPAHANVPGTGSACERQTAALHHRTGPHRPPHTGRNTSPRTPTANLLCSELDEACTSIDVNRSGNLWSQDPRRRTSVTRVTENHDVVLPRCAAACRPADRGAAGRSASRLRAAGGLAASAEHRRHDRRLPRQRRLDAWHHPYRRGRHPPCLRRQRLPRAARAAERCRIRRQHGQDRLATVHPELRRLVRVRALRAQQADRRGPASRRRAAHLDRARRQYRRSTGRYLRLFDAVRPDIPLSSVAPPSLRRGAYVTDLDGHRRPPDRPRVRGARRPRQPARGRRTHEHDAALERRGDRDRHAGRARRAAHEPDRRR